MTQWDSQRQFEWHLRIKNRGGEVEICVAVRKREIQRKREIEKHHEF